MHFFAKRHESSDYHQLLLLLLSLPGDNKNNRTTKNNTSKLIEHLLNGATWQETFLNGPYLLQTTSDAVFEIFIYNRLYIHNSPLLNILLK